MLSPTTFFGTLILSAMLIAHGTAHAGEDADMAIQGPLVQAEAADAPRPDSAANYAQPRQNIPTEIELVTGDG